MYDDVADDVKKKGYVAISHVWGNQIPHPANTLGITGVNWDIPLSNPDKISRLVDAMMEYDMEYCWFDVLCIPQGKENQWQVDRNSVYGRLLQWSQYNTGTATIRNISCTLYTVLL